jgi:hypothetical protein
MKRQIQTNAAAVTFDVATKPGIAQVRAHALLLPSSGPSGGSTTANRAVNTDGAELKLGATWSLDEREMSPSRREATSGAPPTMRAGADCAEKRGLRPGGGDLSTAFSRGRPPLGRDQERTRKAVKGLSRT